MKRNGGARQRSHVPYQCGETLAALVAGHSVFQGGASSCIAGFSLERVWQHSLQTAIAARAIALHEKQYAVRTEEAFLAGLLHEVGKVVYATRSAVVNDPAASDEDTVAQMEAHHAEVGAYLLGLWGFPNSIVEAVAFHHQPSRASGDGFGLAGLIHVANRLVHEREAQETVPSDSSIEPGYLDKLGLTDHVPQWSAALAALH